MQIENPFEVDQCVVCIREGFKMCHTTADKSRLGKIAKEHPKIGEVLSIDEILGEYLRFEKYDCMDDQSDPDYGWRWFKHKHFRAATEQETEDYFQSVAKRFVSAVFGDRTIKAAPN